MIKMTAIMAANAIHEERRREELIIRQKKKQEDDILLRIQNNPSTQIQYGCLWYYTYNMQGVTLSNYHVLYTASTIEEINNYIEQQFIHYLRNKVKTNLLFYQVSIDPNIVSYDFITRSTYPYVKIQILKHQKLCTLNGNINLTSQLILPTLVNYNLYYNQIIHMKKKALIDHYIEIFDTYPIKTKSMTIKKLLKNKKSILLQ